MNQEEINAKARELTLPMYDVEELNEIVIKFNNNEITIIDFVGIVWNKAYSLGRIDAEKRNF